MQSLIAKEASRIPASRYTLLAAAVLLIIPVYPFRAVSALLSGMALFLSLRQTPGNGRTIASSPRPCCW